MMKRQLFGVEKSAVKVKSLPRCFETPGPLGGKRTGLIARCWWRCTRETRLEFFWTFRIGLILPGHSPFAWKQNLGVLFA